MASFVRAVLLAVVVGLALGVGGQLASDLHPGLRWVVALGVPWLVGAFVAGAMIGDRGRGALAGSLALVVGTLAYYAVRFGLEGSGVRGLSELPVRGVTVVVGWSVAAVGAGALFGLTGALWRSGGSVAKVIGAAVISGSFVGEALLLTQEWVGRGAHLVLAVELTAGVALAFLLPRRRELVVPALVLTAVVALAVAVTEDGVRDALRLAGWRGA